MAAFTLLGHRTFPTQHQLLHQACCPSMDLALLTAPSAPSNSSPTIHNDSINCFRLSGSTPQVWSVPVNSFFAENASCVDLWGQPVEIRAESTYDAVDALHWCPDGQCLAAALSSTSSARPPAFIVLSAHSGQLLSFPTLVTQSRDKSSHPNQIINFIQWLPLPPSLSSPHPTHQNTPETSSIGQELCDRLPANLTVPQLKNIETFRNYMGPVYTPSSSKATGKLYDHYPMIRFPPSLITDQHQPKQRPKASSLLILSTNVNQLHFFLNGTVYLGTTSLHDQVQLVGAHLLGEDAPPLIPLDPSHRGGVRVKLVWLDSSNSIGFGTLDLLPSLSPSHPSPNKPSLQLNVVQVKPSLSVVGINSRELDRQIQLSNEIQGLLKDCFFAYFGIVKDWHVARATGKKWYENFNDLSKAHNVTAPISFQMLELLFLGQSNEGLRDYLGTKSGERTFTKWETTVLGNLTRIRLAIIELLVPAAERLYILATELRLHTYAPHLSVKIIQDDDLETLLLVESLIACLIKAVHTLDKSVKEEETLFGHFCKWLRSEFDYVIALESSPTPPTRPQFKYDLMAISNFIQRGETNSLDKVIFPQFRSETEDLKYLQESKARLSQKFYQDFFDVNGPESRMELKKKLGSLLSSHYQDNKDFRRESIHESNSASSRTQSAAHLTPDISHFSKPGPNLQFQTPNLAEHMKRQAEVAMTPSNPSMYNPISSSPSGSNMPSNRIDSLKSHSQPLEKSWGIYSCLTYTSSLISQVFSNIFSKIASEKQLLRHTLLSKDVLLKPIKRNISSRFVNNIHYSAFLSSLQDGDDEVLVVNRIQPSSSSSSSSVENPLELVQTQVIIPLKLPPTCIENHQNHQTLHVLDLDFFDHVEFVLLVHLDSPPNINGYFMVTLNFIDLFIGISNQTNLTEIPVRRIHGLSSDLEPNQMGLNGSVGRRTGCITSGHGTMLHVFDME